MELQAIVNYWGNVPEDEFYSSNGVKNTKGYFESPHGKLFTQSWLPIEGKPKGIICLTHGYGSDSGWLFQTLPIAMAQWGYAAYAADVLGHGRSDGLHGLVQSFENVASASLSFFKSVRGRKQNQGLPAALFGESMGGAITLLMHFEDPKGWDGMILSAPMIILGPGMRPSWLHLTGAKLCFGLIDTWPVFPTTVIPVKLFRDDERGKIAVQNPRRYKLKPRVKTMLEICRVTDNLQANLRKVSLPFLTLHGTDDMITDPESSKALYSEAASSDKTLKLYDGAYHSLIQGELKDVRESVLLDIRSWLDARLRLESREVV